MNGSAGRNSETRAIVTGGAQGIGFAVAEALADEGCRALALVGRSREKGDKAVAALGKGGVDAIFISADVSVVADCKRVVETAIAHFGTSTRWSTPPPPRPAARWSRPPRIFSTRSSRPMCAAPSS